MIYRTMLAGLVALAACGDNTEVAGEVHVVPDACNPLGGQGCLLPWPSMAYFDGGHIAIPAGAMPVNASGVAVDPASLARWDGFSPTAPMIAIFAKGVSGANLPSFHDPDASLAAASPIVVLDLDRGERVPFFAEIDQNVIDSDPDRALIIRPLARLRERTHYAVAIRRTVKSRDGSELPIAPAFAALRDGAPYDHPRFAALAATAPQMFAALEAAGVRRDELALAWDFVTASDAMLRRDLSEMRTDALAAIGDRAATLVAEAGGSGAPPFALIPQSNTPQSHRRYLGTYKSPDFLTHGEEDDSILRRDAAGRPQRVGLRDARLAAIVPKCVETQPLPRPTILFGHGLFGSAQGYLDDAFVQKLAEDHCLVIIAGDFIGLSERQLVAAAYAAGDLNLRASLTEKLAQSVVDFIALESITRGPLATAPAFRLGGTADGAPVIDPAQTFYIGGSLGGIMGNVIMAYDPNLTRGVLAVPGGNWSLLFERSTAWGVIKLVLQSAYRDPQVYELNASLFAMAFEPYDPITTAAHVVRDPLFADQPAKHVLLWYSSGDCLVSNLTTEMMARTMGIPMIGPSVRPAWQVPIATGEVDSGVVLFDEHPAPLPPESNYPPAQDNGTHGGINGRAAALRMVQRFLFGSQKATDGCALPGSPDVAAPCDCATGACD